MASVILDNVAKRFGSVVAVHPISLDIEDREFVVLVGPSGCGKIDDPAHHRRPGIAGCRCGTVQNR